MYHLFDCGLLFCVSVGDRFFIGGLNVFFTCPIVRLKMIELKFTGSLAF